MNCPFCAEEIRDEAVVCKHCRRDLSITRPVMDQLKAMAAKVEAVEAANAALTARLDALESQPRAEAPVEASQTPDAPAMAASAPASRVGVVLTALLVPILALIAAHWLVVMVLDLKFWVIRAVSLAVPLAFALALPIGFGHRLLVPAFAGLAVGGAAVFGMMTVTGLMDGQPILPQDAREWREVVEYGISMWLSYLTGGLLSAAMRQRPKDAATDTIARRLARDLAKLTAPENESRQQLEKRIQTLAGTIGTLVPVVTGAGSIIAGMRKLWE